MKQHTQSVSAFILHSRPFKETSLIIQLFSLELGCFSVIAKGIKGKLSQARKAILRPFLELSIQYTGKSELKILVQCEVKQTNITQSVVENLRGKSLACAYYANELIIRACPERHEYPELFHHYRQFIQDLKLAEQDSNFPVQVSLRNFEVCLLTSMGIAPDWYHDIEQLPIESNKEYYVIPEVGFQLAEPGMEYSSFDLTSHENNCFSGESILSLINSKQAPQYYKSCQQITAIFLKEIIGNKPLQSRKLWQHLNFH